MDIKPLVNLTSRAIAKQISGKSPEEIRKTFSSLNPENEPSNNSFNTSSLRHRLQQKISLKKKQEEEKKMMEQMAMSNNSKQKKTEETAITITFQKMCIMKGANNANDNNNKQQIVPSSSNDNKKIETQKQQLAQQKKKNNKKKQTNQQKSIQASDILFSPDQSPQPSNHTNEYKSTMTNSNPNEPNGNAEEKNTTNTSTFDPELEAAVDREVEEFRIRLEKVEIVSYFFLLFFFFTIY